MNILINEDCLTAMYSQTFKNIIKNKNVIIVTDPPFNIGYHYNNYKDKMDEESYYEWLENVFLNYPFVVIHYPEAIYKISFQIGRFPEKVVSWVYNSNTAKQHRDIAFFDVKPDFRQVTQPYKNPNDKRIKKRIADGCRGGDFTIGGMSTRLRMFQRLKRSIHAKCHKKLWIISLEFCQNTII